MGAQALLRAYVSAFARGVALLRVAQKSMRRSRQENLDIRLSMICSSRRVRGQRKISPYVTQMTSSVIRVPNATSVKKCPPKAMRDKSIATVNTAAAPMAAARHGGGISTAGANSQAATLDSPDTNEQLLEQGPLLFHHGM